MSLISKEDLIKVSGLDKKIGFFASPMASAIMKLTKINKVNALYDKTKNYEGQEFFDKLLRELDIKYLAFKEDLLKISKTGPFILVSNHPLGALDGIIMCKILTEIRPDFKVMGNFLLTKIKPMAPYVISVNPFENRKDAFNSMSGMRDAIQHIKDGNCLGIFPAGEVSNKNNDLNEIQDKEWEETIMKFIKKMKVPVVPMYFHAKNSKLFYNLSKIHPELQTLLLPSEMVNKREKPIKLRIGRAVPPKTFDEYDTPKELEKFLRKKVYIMKSYFDNQKYIDELIDTKKDSCSCKEENIIKETPINDILKDINILKKEEGKLLFSNGNYDVFFTKFDEVPSIMREIGRQREITFRAVGEGTNMPYDLDEYDKYYYHLILWDNSDQKIVGAYRMALGKEVMSKYGIKGFYTNSLFDFDQELYPFFNNVIEMGRAYISNEYQQKPLPLFLLWRGIVHVCLRNPDHKFLIGGVSISSRFTDFSKSLMVEFMRSNYFDPAVAQYVHPKNEYKVRLNEQDKKLFFEDLNNDLNKFDKLIDDLEPEMRMPVLIKKYIKQNAKVISFNVDPNFNDAIDGLMYIKISDLPEETINPIMEEINEKLK